MKEGIIRRIVNFMLLLAGVAGLAALFYFRRDKEPPPPEPPAVRVAKPVVRDVKSYYDFTGNTEAIEFLEIRARVEGFLQSIHFKESQLVEEDDLLFIIDPIQYQAKFDEAVARLRAAKAELERAQIDLERVQEAVKTNAVSEREVSTRKAQRDIAAAEVKAAEAVLINAEVELGYTKVVSPIAGRTSRRLVDIGNLVGAGEKTLLTTVVKVAPIYVYFNVSELILLEVLGEDRAKKSRNPDSEFYVGLASEKGYTRKGTLDYIDNTVDPATGTIQVRGILENVENPILPGMFVRVRVPAKVKKDAILVQEVALGTEIGGKFLLVIGKDDIVEQRPVTIGMLSDGMRVIEEGITPDEQYIVEGIQMARPGMPVKIDTSERPKPEDQKKKASNKKYKDPKDTEPDAMEDKLNMMMEKLEKLEKNIAEMESEEKKSTSNPKDGEKTNPRKEMPWDVQ